MTWQSLICFNIALATFAQAGTVVGEFELTGSREATVLKQKDYSGVVVWLEPVNGTAPIATRRTFTINQKNKRFSPHVVVMPQGSELTFPNNDPIFHNAFSTFSGQPFDTGLYPPGGTQKVVFRRSGIVRVFCNIHSNMSAVVVVTPSPWFAVSGKDGRFSILNVPAGEYQLKIRQRDVGQIGRRAAQAAIERRRDDSIGQRIIVRIAARQPDRQRRVFIGRQIQARLVSLN